LSAQAPSLVPGSIDHCTPPFAAADLAFSGMHCRVSTPFSHAAVIAAALPALNLPRQ
jgi:hypothetical protein